MTSIGLLIVVAGVGLIWAGVTDVAPIDAFKAAISGNASPSHNAGTKAAATTSASSPGAPATPIVAQPNMAF